MHGATLSFPDYTFYATPLLLTAYADGPGRMRAAIEGLTEQETRARSRGPGKWSIHEIILHSADSEVQGSFRIRKIWSEPGSTLPIYDQDAWTREIAYQEEGGDARERALQLLALLREQTLPILRRATDEDWAKSSTHPDYGPVTLRNLLEIYADHTERHIEQILEGRARMGRPIELKPLLPRRLY